MVTRKDRVANTKESRELGVAICRNFDLDPNEVTHLGFDIGPDGVFLRVSFGVRSHQTTFAPLFKEFRIVPKEVDDEVGCR